MGIRFYCPNGHKLNVKSELAGKIGVCPKCQARMAIPWESVRESSRRRPTSETETAEKTPEATEKVEQTSETSAKTARGTDASNVAAAEDCAASRQPTDETATERFFGGARAEAALGDVLRRAVDGRSAERFDDLSEPLRDARLLWYVRTLDNQQYGPATGDVLRTWINERRISPKTLVWREDWAAWQEAGNVFPELERVFVGPDGATVDLDGGSAASAFASLAEAAQNSDAARRFVSNGETRALRRRKRATKTFVAIAGLIAAIVALLGALIYILTQK